MNSDEESDEDEKHEEIKVGLQHIESINELYPLMKYNIYNLAVHNSLGNQNVLGFPNILRGFIHIIILDLDGLITPENKKTLV